MGFAAALVPLPGAAHTRGVRPHEGKECMRVHAALLAICVVFFCCNAASGSRARPFWRGDMVAESDAIVIGTAVREFAPGDPEASLGPARGLSEIWPLVEFHVGEVLKGTDVPDTVVLWGTLTDTDNFNRDPVPYPRSAQRQRRTHIKPDRYARGQRFLLFLDRETDDTTGRSYFIVQYDGHAPNSEQLRSDQDPWLLWVRGFLEGAGYASREAD